MSSVKGRFFSFTAIATNTGSAEGLGAGVDQSVRTLDLGSAHNLKVMRSSTTLGSELSMESAWSAWCAYTFSLSK